MPDLGSPALWYDLTYKVVFNAAKTLLAPLQRDSFLYWPFLVSTLVIALLAWRFGWAGGREVAAGRWSVFRRRYLGSALWWHPSSRADYRFYIVNGILFPLLLGPLLFNERAVAGALQEWLSPWLGASAGEAAPGAVAVMAYTLLFFVAYDFGRFVAHSLLHDVPLLWEFHKVHHSAEVLTPFTSFRTHPVDLAVMVWVPAVTTGVVAWGFQRFVSPGIGFHTFLGLHVLIWIFSLAGNLRHWQVWVSYGATLNHWLISPAHHQLHHSAEVSHRGCNRGFELAVWDRLYGTLRIPQNTPETFRMGLGDGTDGQWNTLWRLYVWPFAGCLGRGAVPVSSSVDYRYRRLWLAVGWAMVAAVLVLSLVPLSVDLSEGKDKVSHFVAYGSLMFWFGLLYPGWRRETIVAIGFVAMGVIVEFLQGMTGYRSFDVNDMVANAIGVAMGWVALRTPLRRVLCWIETWLQ